MRFKVRSRRWNSSRVFFSAFFAVLLIAVQGCSLGSNTSSSSSSQNITIVWWTGKLHESGYKAWSDSVISQYEQLHPNVTINAVEPGGIYGYQSAMKAALASGSGLPDLIGLDSDAFQTQLTAAGDFLDLSPFIKADPEWQKSAKYYSVDSALSFMYKGDIYQAPVDAAPSVVYYWKDMFQQAGITALPQTIDDYYALVPKLKAIGVDTLATGIKSSDVWQDDAWFWQLAANVNYQWVVKMQANNCGAKYAGDPTATQALNTFAQLYHQGVISKAAPEMSYDPDQKTAFYSRKAAMAWSSGLWLDGGFGDNISKVGILPFPPAPDGHYSLDTLPGINLGAVNVTETQKSSAHQKAVADLIKFLSGPVGQKAIWDTGYSLPLDPGAIGSERDPSHSLIVDLSKLVHTPQFQAIFQLASVPQVDNAIGNGALGVLLGAKTVSQALADVDAACASVH
jgi:raffinose/stachyose/melibiose transport system substrate-binding protein